MNRNKCKICGKKAEIKRHFEGTYLCKKHFLNRLYNDIDAVLKRIDRLYTLIDNIIVIDLSDDRTELLIKKIKKHNFYDRIKKSSIHFECSKLQKEIEYIEELKNFIDTYEKSVIILPYVAEELAHHLMLSIMFGRFELIDSLTSKRVIKPFDKYFTHELDKIFSLNIAIKERCPIGSHVTKLSKSRPSSIFSIHNFAEKLKRR